MDTFDVEISNAKITGTMVKSIIVFSQTDEYDDIDEENYYEREYRCSNCGFEDTAYIVPTNLCPTDQICPQCKCNQMNPTPIVFEENE